MNLLLFCSGMMFWMMEEKLVKNLIFLCLYWDGIILFLLLVRIGVLFMLSLDKGRNVKCKELIFVISMVGKKFILFKFYVEVM